MAKNGKLPDWAKENKKDGFIEVKPSVVYPLYFKKLGYKDVTQNGLEVARKCFTEDLYGIVGKGLKIRILKDEKWRLSNYPEGPDLNFRSEYRKITE